VADRFVLTIVAVMLAAVLGAADAATPVPSAGDLSSIVKEASRILIRDNGRIKPLATYARYTLFSLSGQYSCAGLSAIEWLCKLLFSPETARDYPVFLINNPETADALGIAPQKKRRYTHRQLEPAFVRLDTESHSATETDPASRSSVENELLRTAAGVRKHHDLAGIFSADTLYTSQHIRGNTRFDIIPLPENGMLRWYDPAALQLRQGKGDSGDPALDALVRAYRDFNRGSYTACAGDLRTFNAEVARRLERNGVRSPVSLELLYNAADPFSAARLAYFIALLLLTAGLAGRSRFWPRTGGVLVAAGFLMHAAGIFLRVLIMHRAPVTTLYETFVFVGWMSVLLGLVMEAFQRKGYGIFVASCTGTLFLSIAGKFGAEGDTMGALAPILNNNFWLSTHIITVSMGYAGCFAAGVLAHLFLIQKLFLRLPADRTAPLAGSLYATLAFGLTFTVIGTVLGGLWAEQAWGRFWGWDPKENGALLVILWCAIVLHARAAGSVRETGLAFGAVIGLMIVMLAWVGVNLLGIGMHAYGRAYGFTTLGARLLFSVLVIEALFLVLLGATYMIRRKSDGQGQ
jgi:ABC-type transport system involved in cytochrome c biogenesis permease subunit